MLEIDPYVNTWQPGEAPEELPADAVPMGNAGGECLVIIRETPYIEACYLRDARDRRDFHRFVFHEDYHWPFKEERLFEACCVKNTRLRFDSAALNRIFDYYSARYPGWHLKRYHTHDMRMLDHIYHCCRRNSAKEMLYKAGLDVLAEQVSGLDELNLLATKPSELYNGLFLKTLRALNCREGAALISRTGYRLYLLELQKSFPDLFRQRLNDAQCRYLKRLICGGLVPGETGRLFRARKNDLMLIWNDYMYYAFLTKEKNADEYRLVREALGKIDPIYTGCFDRLKSDDPRLTLLHRDLQYYLLAKREECDLQMRRANRKRDSSWQEREYGYVVRYPQTINDFCRESVYMGNCLMTYAEAVLHNDTNVLFLRREEDVNHPYITLEIQNNCLMQAYHRFNEDCTGEEAVWIRAYCRRHGIRTDRFCFDRDQDRLF